MYLMDYTTICYYTICIYIYIYTLIYIYIYVYIPNGGRRIFAMIVMPRDHTIVLSIFDMHIMPSDHITSI